MPAIILTTHIIISVLLFGLCAMVFFSYIKPYSQKTYRALIISLSVLFFGEFLTGSLMIIAPNEPLNYTELYVIGTLYTIIAIVALYILYKKNQNSLPLPAQIFLISSIVPFALIFVM